jgi:Ca2+-binding RTX toxin-like protein
MPFTHNTLSTAQENLNAVEDLGVVTANGSIVHTSICVLMPGERARLINAGLIASGNIAVSVSNDVQIVNTGSIVGELNAISLSIGGVFDTTTTITNSGQLIAYDGSAIASFDSGIRIINSGLISGSATGVSFGSSSGTQTSFLSNTGTIAASGASASAVSTFGTAVVVNSGLISGNVSMSSGNDTLDNRLGEISGNVTMGNGNNLFRGGATDESVSGGSGLDTLRGGAGDDSLNGSTGNDLLVGGDGNDYLQGDVNDDTLRGGDGDDTIWGGETVDVMFGGRGSDVFVFTSISESDTLQTADLIADFSKKDDVIDLDTLGFITTTPIAYAGTGPFAGGGVSSVRHERDGGIVIVSVDGDGDGVADMVIHVTGTASLTAANFLL